MTISKRKIPHIYILFFRSKGWTERQLHDFATYLEEIRKEKDQEITILKRKMKEFKRNMKE